MTKTMIQMKYEVMNMIKYLKNVLANLKVKKLKFQFFL